MQYLCQQPKQYEKALENRKRCVRVWDCNGLIEGVYQLYSGVCINKKSWYNYLHWCKPKGSGMIPESKRVPGAAVFRSSDPNKASKIHHVAYLWKPVVDGHPDGDWYVIECTSAVMGVRTRTLYDFNPHFWGHMTKYIEYRDAVEITGKSINIRNAPGTTGTKVIGTAKKGQRFAWMGNTKKVALRNWFEIMYNGQAAWVSGKYAKLVNK